MSASTWTPHLVGTLWAGKSGKRTGPEQMTYSTSRAWKALPVLGLLFLTCALWGRAAWACNCKILSEKEMVRRADIAIEATVITDALFDIWTRTVPPHRSSQQAVTVFRIDQVLKGSLPQDRIGVLHNIYPPTCGLRFAPDMRYLLIFVRKRDDKPRPAGSRFVHGESHALRRWLTTSLDFHAFNHDQLRGAIPLPYRMLRTAPVVRASTRLRDRSSSAASESHDSRCRHRAAPDSSLAPKSSRPSS